MPAGFTDNDVPDQSGKIAVVTGANTGLGFHTARVLAERGARVLLACRTKEKAQAAIDEIQEQEPAADVEFLALDLADLKSVRKAAKAVEKEPQLDLLINNAGVMWPARFLTQDGFEGQFGTNHLGPFAFTGLLIDKVMATPEARVVSTSSLGHLTGRIHFNDINAERLYFRHDRYAMSKLANLLFTYELERRLRDHDTDAISVACHPGLAATELGRHLPGGSVAMPVLGRMFNTSDQGAWPTLMAATDPSVRGGQYFGPSGIGEMAGPAKVVRSNPLSHSKRYARRLWDLSVEMTGVDPGI